jgi:hypothetical protein
MIVIGEVRDRKPPESQEEFDKCLRAFKSDLNELMGRMIRFPNDILTRKQLGNEMQILCKRHFLPLKFEIESDKLNNIVIVPMNEYTLSVLNTINKLVL